MSRTMYNESTDYSRGRRIDRPEKLERRTNRRALARAFKH